MKIAYTNINSTQHASQRFNFKEKIYGGTETTSTINVN